MIAQLFEIIAPVLITAGLGFGWGRLGWAYDEQVISRLIMMVGAPCLVFSSFLSYELPLAALGQVMLAALTATAGFAVIGLAVLKAARLPLSLFLPPLMFVNAGNIGLPLCLFAFGERGLAIAVGYFVVAATLQYTVGAWIYSGHALPTAGLKTPLPYAAALSAVLLVLGVKPPGWILDTAQLIGGLTIPLMLITLGVSLARLGVTKPPRSLALGALRIGMGLGVGLAVAELFGLSGVVRGVVVLEAAMPAAVFNYLLATHYGRGREEAASLAVVSTLIAFAALPFILLLVL